MKSIVIRLAAVVAALSAPLSFAASDTVSMYPVWSSRFVNFSGTGPSGSASDTLPNGQKFLSVVIKSDATLRGTIGKDIFCAELKTQSAADPNMDTQIWLRKADGSLVPVSDNDGTSKFSRLLVQIKPVSYPNSQVPPLKVELLVAAKSTLNNAGNFNLVQTTGLGSNYCYYGRDPYIFADEYGTQVIRSN